MTDVVYALGYRTWADGASGGYAFSPERIAQRLRDDPTVPRVVLADPVRSHLGRLVPRPATLQGPRGRAAVPSYSHDPTRRHVRPGRWGRGEPLDRTEAVMVQRRLDRRLQRLVDPADAVLVTSHPVLAAVADRDVWSDVAFYAWDDFRGFPGAVALVDWAYEQLARRDVNVVAVARAILDLVGARRSTLVPNGIVAQDFEGAGRPPAWFEEVEGPVALYAGSLQGRVDVEALQGLARDLPGWTLVLVGPMQEPDRFRALRGLPNVVLRPAEPRSAVLAMMAAATVCLVPHLPEAERMSPLKVYEYLGAGAPVVATDLGPLRGLSPHCRTVPHGAPLAPAVVEAAAAPRASSDEVARFRTEHDWDRRYLDWRAAILGA